MDLRENVVPVQRLSVAPFDNWTYGDCDTAVRDSLPKNFTRLKSFVVDKDHFRGGKEWVGPGDGATNDSIKKQFVADDFVNTALKNIHDAFGEAQVNFVAKQQPKKNAEVPEEVQALIDEASALVSDWWDKRHLQELIRTTIHDAAWSSQAGLRMWIPERYLQLVGAQVQVRRAQDFAEAASFIHVMVPKPQAATVVTHVRTQDLCSIFLDVMKQDDGTEVQRAEMMFLDPERTTDRGAEMIIRIVYGDDRRSVRGKIKLNGYQMFGLMSFPSILTDPVMDTQSQCNFYRTIITHMGVTSAFRERYLGNVMAQGRRTEYNDGDVIPDGSFIERDPETVKLWVVTPQQRTLGSNTTNELVGLPKMDNAEGRNVTGHETPIIYIADPVDPRPYVETAESIRKSGLRMCSQGHLAQTSTAEASGFAYEQSRATFAKDLNARKVPLEGLLRDTLMGFLGLVETITGQPGHFTDFIRPEVNQYVDPGPRSPDSIRIDLESNEAGLLSDETTMSRNGVEDLNGEMGRLRKSASWVFNLLKNAAEAPKTVQAKGLKAIFGYLGLPSAIADSFEDPAPPVVSDPTKLPGKANDKPVVSA